ncbi:MAG: response regulator [Gammaproteobacteria bacterium]|nr:response regulator [Gammaproteobacteria bacterium]MDH5653116.1 response regulator [Gammaproteobacteria bacterium]
MINTNGLNHVLVVDDDKIIQMLLINLLSDMFEVDAVSSAKEALTVFNPQRHFLVITDNFMPQITGIELIQKMNSEVPCILISSEDLEKEAYQAGAVFFQRKTHDMVSLLDKAIEIWDSTASPPPTQ